MLRELRFLGRSFADLQAFPRRVQQTAGRQLRFLQEGGEPELIVSSTSPSSRTLSTSSIASKRKPRKRTSGTSISPQGASANFSADDETIGEPITNIFEALFDDPVEAARLTLLADMSIAIE
eukprot:gene4092-5403_t